MLLSSRFVSTVRITGLVAVMVAMVFVGGCKRKYQAPAKAEFSPDDIKALVSNLATKRQVGFIKDIRIPSAENLGNVGPQAKEYGAIPALEKMAKDKDPTVKEAAEKALAKIKAGG